MDLSLYNAMEKYSARNINNAHFQEDISLSKRPMANYPGVFSKQFITWGA